MVQPEENYLTNMEENMYNDDGRQYLQMMQENIARMAANSANCKNWMVTLVAGMLAISCGISALNGWILLTLVPVLVFWYLDTFYLELERKMRNRQLDYILKVKKNDSDGVKDALFCFAPLKKEKLTKEEESLGYVATNDRAFSASIAPFYCSILVVVLIVSFVLNFEEITTVLCKLCCHGA